MEDEIAAVALEALKKYMTDITKRLENLETTSGVIPLDVSTTSLREAITYKVSDEVFISVSEVGSLRRDKTFAEQALKANPSSVSTTFSALAHPDRIKIVQYLMSGVPAKQGELKELLSSSSSGQLYYHINALKDIGIVNSLSRGTYTISRETIVRLLLLFQLAV